MSKGTKAAKKDKDKAARKFKDEYLQSMHVSTEGWPGIPLAAFRGALVSA